MVHSLEDSRDWQADMHLAGKLFLSAAALFLLTLAYRFYKSRTPAFPQRSGITEEELGSLAGEIPAEVTDAAPGLRYRHVTGNGVKQNCIKTDYQCGTVAVETWGPHGNVHQGKGEEYETSDFTLKKHKNQARKDKQAELLTESHPLEVADTDAIPLTGEDKCKVAATEKCVNLKSSESKTNYDLTNRNDLQAKSPQQGEESNCEVLSQKSEAILKRSGSAPKLQVSGGVIEDDRQEPEGEEMMQSSVLIHESQVSGLQTINARSGINLHINQTHEKSDGLHTFSSIAEIQVKENYIKEKQPEDDSSTQTSSTAVLKTKIYNYYVSSTSESLSKERSNSIELSSPPQPKADKELLGSESGFNPSQELGKKDNVKTFVTTQALSSMVPSHESEKCWKPEASDRMEQAHGFSGAPQNQEFHKMENFMKSEDNIGLPVRMQEFHSSTSDSTNSRSSPANKPTVQSLSSTQPGSNVEPSIEMTASDKCFQLNKDLDLAMAYQLSLGNCYDVLCTAKQHKLHDLQEAAYKVMSDNYLQILQNPSIYRHLNAAERELILERRMNGRKYVTVADVDPQDYNPSASQNSSRLCFYDDENDSWHTLSYIPTEVISMGCAMGVMFNYLFVAVGCEGHGRQQKLSNRVFCYNPLNDNWSEVSPLNQARPQCKLVALDGCLYAIGGECQYTVERYDPRQDQWTFTAPLPNGTFAVAHTATVCDNEIYVTGGTLRYMMIKYNCKEDSWKISVISGSKDRTTEIVSVNTFIYRFDLNRSMGISVYRCSARARLWYECAINRIPYPASFQCAVINNRIYCISRQFTLSFLADEVSPKFLGQNLKMFPSPKGTLLPFVLILPDRGSARI